jgi:starch synthase
VFENCDVAGLQHALGLALLTLREHPDDFREIQKRGMARDSSWDTAAQQYEQVVGWAAQDQAFCK